MNLRPITPADIQWARDNFIKASEWARQLHKNDKDRGGNPYSDHLAYVATVVRDSAVAHILAWFHDSIEHGHVTVEELLAAGFPLAIVQRIVLLTRRDTQDYEDYIRGVGADHYTRRVKMADIEHNLQLGRLKKWSDKLIPLIQKYMLSLQILKEMERAAQQSHA